MTTIKSIIIDDEQHCRKILELCINKYCPDVKILAKCKSGIEGVRLIKNLKPDLVFLDIEMPKMNGFDMLEQLESIDFDIIFTTAHEQYALEAFKVNAIDYLLKPIGEEELINALEKIRERKIIPEYHMETIVEQIKRNIDPDIQKVPIPSSRGIDFVDINRIIYCKAESNYTFVILTGKKKKVIARTLKDFSKLLPSNKFFRCHHSYIVNLNHINTYIKSEGGYLIMSNNDKVGISRSKRESFLNKF